MASDLPALAIEAIALHVAAQHCASASSNDGQSEDPRRTVLPLVSREWRRALQLTPGLWSEVVLTTADLFPSAARGASQPLSPTAAAAGAERDGSPPASACRSPRSAFDISPPASSRRLRSWFAARAGQVQRLAVRLRWSPELCRSEDLQVALIGVLESCAPGLQSLALEVQGAPLLACTLWRQLAGPPLACPGLRRLELCLEGNAFLSEAANTGQALRALKAACAVPQLESLAVTLHGVKLLNLPMGLPRLACLRSFRLSCDPQMRTLPLLPPCARAAGWYDLPPTLISLELEHTVLGPTAALDLPGKLPLLQRFRLTW